MRTIAKQCKAHLSYSLSFILVAGIACDSVNDSREKYLRPPQTGDGWETASLEEVGMEPNSLLALLNLISSTDNHMIHSLLIVKDQKLVFEEYWHGIDLEPRTLIPVEKDFNRQTLHWVASVSKSITSTLVGIAIDQGLIGSVEESLFSYFPEYSNLRREDNGQITLEHLLSFTSGYDWNEFVYESNDPRDSHYQMFNASDPIGYLLDRAVVSAPGSEFHYNSGDTNILGEIVRRTSSSVTLVDFAHRYLFQPLGIESYDWWMFPLADEMTFASGGASLRPRDMAKLGALFLNGGVWNGERIVSEEWVHASTEQAMPPAGDHRTIYGYGYNWWLGRSLFRDSGVLNFHALGWGGQFVFVFPDLELITVFTAGGYYDTGPLDIHDIIEYYILESIVE